MTAFTAGAVLTASALNTAFNTATINAITATSYTFGSADAGELVTLSNASGGTATIPAAATWGAATGTIIGVLNAGTAGSFTIGTAAGVTLNASSATLAALESGQLVKTATNTWYFVKGGGLPKASGVTATGTFSTDSVTRAPKTVYRFTGTGTIQFTNAGVAEVLVSAGGGAGGAAGAGRGGGGGGAGGYLYLADAYFDTTSQTVTIGGGGAGGGASGGYGTGSRVGRYATAGGGGGGVAGGGTGLTGASSGGGGDTNGTVQSLIITGQGNLGAQNASGTQGGGGGGSSAAGSGTGGGAGTANSITGASVTYSAGGSHGTGGAGGANTGNGGQGASGANGFNGGSGVVIVVVG